MHAPDPPDLHEDCSRCAALCCAAFGFEKGQGFGADKPIDVPCAHLGGTSCSIHPDRAALGYSGCIAYTCHGAGPYVTQVMFGGADTAADPSRLPAMTRALRDLARLQELRVLLAAAQSLPLSQFQEAQRADLAAALLPQGTWTQAALDAACAGPIPQAVKDFLRALRPAAADFSDADRDAPRPAVPSGSRNRPPHPHSR